MPEQPPERQRPNLEAVRETMQERDEELEAAREAEEEFEQDPSRNPDDPNIEGLKGG